MLWAGRFVRKRLNQYILHTTDKEKIIKEIAARTGLDRAVVGSITVFEFDDEVVRKIEELAYELKDSLDELGEVYLEIIEERNKTTDVIDESLKELVDIAMTLGMLDIDPELKEALIEKLSHALENTGKVRASVDEGRILRADGLVSEVVLNLQAFITKLETHQLRIDEDDRERLVERIEEAVENTEDWEIKELAEEIRELLTELDEATAEVEGIVSEPKDLGASLEVTVEVRERQFITTTITAGGVLVKELSSCVTVLMLEKPVVAFYVGSFKNKLLEHFGAEMTFDKRVSLLIFPHTAGKLALVGGEDVLGRVIMT